MEHVGPAEKSFVPFLFFFSFSYRRVSPSSYLIFLGGGDVVVVVVGYFFRCFIIPLYFVFFSSFQYYIREDICQCDIMSASQPLCVSDIFIWMFFFGFSFFIF